MDDAEKRKHYERAEQLLAEQNFVAAVIAGAVATAIAAFAFVIVVARWPIAYGFAAVSVGIIIGVAMQFVGRGIAVKFFVAATVYTLIGCALGNLFVGMSVSGVHFIYWFVAVFAAVFFARRALSRADRLALGLLKLERPDRLT